MLGEVEKQTARQLVPRPDTRPEPDCLRVSGGTSADRNRPRHCSVGALAGGPPLFRRHRV